MGEYVTREYGNTLLGRWYKFDADFLGNAVFNGRVIPCRSAKEQKIFHTGYELREVDKHDIPIIEKIPDSKEKGV